MTQRAYPPVSDTYRRPASSRKNVIIDNTEASLRMVDPQRPYFSEIKKIQEAGECADRVLQKMKFLEGLTECRRGSR